MTTVEFVWIIYATFPGGLPIPVNADHPFPTQHECVAMLHEPQVVGLTSAAGAQLSCKKVVKK